MGQPFQIYFGLFLFVGLLLPALSARGQSVIYVDQSATGMDDGTSWTNAFVHLQDALGIAANGDKIWVADGIHRPDQGAGVTNGDRASSFVIPSGVSLYGGFLGSEIQVTERNWRQNETILSGDLLGNDDDKISIDNPLRLDNSLHVVQAEQITHRIVIDGFSIVGGMANEGFDIYGGAIELSALLATPVLDPILISNCTFKFNASIQGTVRVTIYPDGESPDLVIDNSVFEENWANTAAGISVVDATIMIKNVSIINNEALTNAAIRSRSSTVFLAGSVIANNRAAGFGAIDVAGGQVADTFYMWNNIISGNETLLGEAGLYVGRANLVSINNIFSGNQSGSTGGAIYIDEGSAKIINSVFSFNTAAESGGAIASLSSNTEISNSIFWKNTALIGPDFFSLRPDEDTLGIGHSLVQGNLPEYVTNRGGIINGSPSFFDADGTDNIPGTVDDDFRLTSFSPAIDAGIITSIFADQLDIDDDNDVTEPWPADFAGNVRIFDGGSGAEIVDMGAYEFNAPPIFTGLFYPESVPITLPTFDVFPNPAIDGFWVQWHHPSASRTRLELFDMAGRFVRTIFNGPASKNERFFVDVTGVVSGVYVVRDTTTGQSVAVIIL